MSLAIRQPREVISGLPVISSVNFDPSPFLYQSATDSGSIPKVVKKFPKALSLSQSEVFMKFTLIPLSWAVSILQLMYTGVLPGISTVISAITLADSDPVKSLFTTRFLSKIHPSRFLFVSPEPVRSTMELTSSTLMVLRLTITLSRNGADSIWGWRIVPFFV